MCVAIDGIVLCISENEQVFEIPFKKIEGKQIKIKNMKNKKALFALFICYFENETARYILNTFFYRTTFDHEGKAIVDFDSDDVQKIADYLTNKKKDNRIPLLPAPIEPNDKELKNIKNYLYEHYPKLLADTPRAIESMIIEARNRHAQNIEILKES